MLRAVGLEERGLGALHHEHRGPRVGARHVEGELVGDPIQTNADPYAMTLSDDGRILAMGTLGDGAAFENGQVLSV